MRTISNKRLYNTISQKVAQILKESDFEPTQEDFDSVMFDDSAEEPDLANQEMGDAHDKDVMAKLRPIAEKVSRLQEEFQETVNFFGEGNYELDELAAMFMEFNDELQKLVGTSEAAPVKKNRGARIFPPEKEINENKSNTNMKKKLNEAQLFNVIATKVAKILKEIEDPSEYMSDVYRTEGAEAQSFEGEIDVEAILDQVKQHAMEDRMVVKEKKAAIEAGDMDEAIRKWIDATMAKGEREGTPYSSNEDVVSHMVSGGSYKRFFYTVARQKQEVRFGHSDKADMNHHSGEKSRMKNSLPAGTPDQIAEAVAKRVAQALKNLK